MTYPEALLYLESFINYERRPEAFSSRECKLKRVFNLFRRLGINQNAIPSVHIAGTKGKGSTATILAYILAASGYKVGLYTSPHIRDARERIQIFTRVSSAVRNALISKESFGAHLARMRPSLENMRSSVQYGTLSFFEIYTAVAFSYFQEERCDFLVVECGLGGRLDATNILKPLISIITPIGFDHTRILGRTLKKIAFEKAGIIKKNSLVISALQPRSVQGVLTEQAKQQKARYFAYGKDFSAQNIRCATRGSHFDFSGIDSFPVRLRLFGIHQVENASCALHAAQLLKQCGYSKIKIKTMQRGAERSKVPGRFEIISHHPFVIVDVAHNPLSAKVLARNLKLYFPGRKIIMVFACSQDKDPSKMMSYFSPESVIFTRFMNPRAYPPLQLKKITGISSANVADSLTDALSIAKKQVSSDSLILIWGSFFLVGEAKKDWRVLRE